ncbi:alpha/beta hydrolase [Sphingobium sufflavum]|uniref:alpha/beta fold hydrolase n=1 Tax=Sphingobium sufflavum TaxID=1129547 RepID=UPI001F2C3E88|nr:alpha/beta fold hydrolase [Sphingobium sufflavum]MCE7796070.1 alpha/beta hydrolase [Sphingobium sufflavum]
MAGYEDRYWWSRDGLRLHFRDYGVRDHGAASTEQPPILCIPGLTRNARDFHPLAQGLAEQGRRVLCAELRGRGESAFAKDPMTYVPLTYLQDLEALLEETGIDRFIGIGTSLGGIMLMLLAATGPTRLAGALLNDIGPAIEEAGLDRIRQTVGTGGGYPTWVHAARALSEVQGALYPDYGLEEWLAYAKRLYRLNSKGRVVLDYDARLAEPFKVPGGESGVDLWPAFDALKACPTVLVRGAMSDILSEETAQAMQARHPDLERVTVPRTGHAPTLFEPECVAAIDRLLERVAASQPVL